MERLESKLDKVVESISRIDVTLAKQAVQLEEHIRRTNLLETQLTSIRSHVNMVQGVGVFIGIIATLAAIAASLVKVFG
jgi:hypothetical protein